MSDVPMEIYRRRVEKLRNGMLEAGGCGYVLNALSNVYYFTGHLETGDSIALLFVPADGKPRLIVHEMNVNQAAAEASDVAVEGVKTKEKSVELIADFASRQDGGPLFFDELPSHIYNQLTKALPKVSLQQRTDLTWKLRIVKTRLELTLMKKAADLASLGVQKAIEEARPGVKEIELAAEAEYIMRKTGAHGCAFESIVASGPRSAWPHGVCGDRFLRNGDAVVVDMGATFRGYRSDITRTIFIGEPSQHQRRVYRTVLSAQRAALKKIRADAAACDTDASARRVIKAAGLERHFTHGTGHGVGIDIHEPPRLVCNSKETLPANSVVTVEPGVYIPGKFGVRIEDMVTVTDRGFTLLTNCPKEHF